MNKSVTIPMDLSIVHAGLVSQYLEDNVMVGE